MSVIQQHNPSHFEVIATVESAVGARTGLWYPSRDRCVDSWWRSWWRLWWWLGGGGGW